MNMQYKSLRCKTFDFNGDFENFRDSYFVN